jgi:sugar phosphate isomerase/epimerase
MLDEIGCDSLKVGLDLPLLESYDPEEVRKVVLRMKGLMVYSHTISLASFKTVGGAPYGWEEVTPGSALDPLPWETFIAACKEIGYNGLFSHEQCSPIIAKGHVLGNLGIIDQRYVEARNYFRQTLTKFGCYTGHKPEVVAYD